MGGIKPWWEIARDDNRGARRAGFAVPPGRGRRPRQRGTMNSTEAAYADELDRRIEDGEVILWRFEAMKFKLAPVTFYTPDFLVLLTSGVVEFHEVKGHWRDDARVKLKLAASMFPEFRFVGVRKRAVKRGGGWQVEVMGKEIDTAVEVCPTCGGSGVACGSESSET